MCFTSVIIVVTALRYVAVTLQMCYGRSLWLSLLLQVGDTVAKVPHLVTIVVIATCCLQPILGRVGGYVCYYMYAIDICLETF